MHAQREEGLARTFVPLGNHGTQHGGILHGDHDRAGGLPGDTTRFQGDCVVTILESLCYGIHLFLQFR